MRKNKGAISIFALLAMMFFLIFVMVAYNNVTQKSKMQVETEDVLVRYYQSAQSAADYINSSVNTNTTEINSNKDDYFIKGKALETAQNSSSTYIYSNGKVYKVK